VWIFAAVAVVATAFITIPLTFRFLPFATGDDRDNRPSSAEPSAPEKPDAGAAPRDDLIPPRPISRQQTSRANEPRSISYRTDGGLLSPGIGSPPKDMGVRERATLALLLLLRGSDALRQRLPSNT
jgi:hypothetical protein